MCAPPIRHTYLTTQLYACTTYKTHLTILYTPHYRDIYMCAPPIRHTSLYYTHLTIEIYMCAPPIRHTYLTTQIYMCAPPIRHTYLTTPASLKMCALPKICVHYSTTNRHIH